MAEQTRPSAIVNSNLDTEAVTVADATVAELLAVCINRLDTERRHVTESVESAESAALVGREFSIAITHCEDAITRANKAHYRARGIFAITDAERTQADG